MQFYDYTKNPNRIKKQNLPKNYYLIFSRDKNNEKKCIEFLKQGYNVAVVFKNLGKALRVGWHGFNVISGEKNDCRFLEPKGVVVGLTIKGHVDKRNKLFVEV